jgi:hypothetical protein
MTNEDLNDNFARLASAIERVSEASTQGLGEIKENQRQFQNNQKKLQLAQLGTQTQIGLLSDMMRQSWERMDQHEASMEQLRHRQVEQDQRFDVLLDELRYLIRNQHPPQPDVDS